MQWSRVKSILVAILIVVDTFLLMTLLGGYYVEHRRETEKSENFITILAEKQVSAAEGFRLPEMQSLPMLEVDRSKNDEDAFTKGLLGEQMERAEEPDGNTLYTSSIGSVEWSFDGKISGTFRPEDYLAPSSERDMRLMTAKLLEHCGISSSVEIEVDLKQSCAAASFDTAGAPVFNRFLQLTFEEEKISISGWWTFQTPYMVRTNNYVSCEAADSILTLLREVPEIRSIDSAEIGYVLSSATGRRTSIVPCCRILTNQGEFFVDSLKNIVIYT